MPNLTAVTDWAFLLPLFFVAWIKAGFDLAMGASA
jgi:hypothetical protein